MSYQQLSVAEGVPGNLSLWFQAASVIVDNYSASWLNVIGGRRVPPWTYGAIVRLVGTVTHSNIVWETAPGTLPPTAGGGTAEIQYTSDLLTPSNGYTVVTPSQQLVCTNAAPPTTTGGGATISVSKANIYTFSFPANGAFTQKVQATVNVPAGANSVVLVGRVTNNGGALVAGHSFSVFGGQSNTGYLSTPLGVSFPEPPLACIVETASDNTLIVTLTAGDHTFGISGTFSVVASFGVQAVAIQGGGGAPIPIDVTTVGGVSLIDTGDTIGGHEIFAVPTANFPSFVAQTVTIDAAIAPGAALTLIAAPGVGSRLRMLSAAIVATAGYSGAAENVYKWRDTTGTEFASGGWDGTAGLHPGWQDFDWQGSGLAFNVGFQLLNSSATVTIEYHGYVTYMVTTT